MIKKIFVVITCLCIMLSRAGTVSAMESGSYDHFQQKLVYDGRFADMAEVPWATPFIRTCYEYGLMNGSSATAFSPKGDLTVAEALAMAARVHEIYHTGTSTLTNGSPWYQPYIDYSAENGIIQAGEFSDFTAKATRAEMAHIFYHALPAFPSVNDVSYVHDVYIDTPYAPDILALYQCGVLTGSDAYGTFNPDSTITRAEAAAIIARVAFPDQRRTDLFLVDSWIVMGDINVAMPQNSLQLEAARENNILLGTEIGDYLTSVLWTVQEELTGHDITALTPEEWHSFLEEAFIDFAMVLSPDAVTELVYYGGLPVYRTFGGYSDEYGSGNSVTVGYIKDDMLIMLTYFTVNPVVENLHYMFNLLRIDNCAVNETL